MGVTGLLPMLKSIHKHKNLKAYAGQTLGIDAFGWLHRGAIACAVALALDKPTTKYLEFVVKRVNMLLDFGITPYLVFDGDAVPSKAGTNADRKIKRQEAQTRGLALYRAGKVSQAWQELQKGVSITPQMTHCLIKELRRLNVPYLVAPYEADAQLAYLEYKGVIDAIISEDSDLLVFGAKTLITKLDEHGDCIEINRADFNLCKDISLAGWSDSMFRRMAILSGCDYLPNINRMGLKTAYTYIRKYKDANRAIHMMALSGSYVVPADYIQKFRDAELAFLYHRVFCPDAQRLVHLNEIPPALKAEAMPFLGDDLEPHVAVGVACGDINPKTKEPFAATASVDWKTAHAENQRHSISSAHGLKPKNSIDSFFGPRRVPLAELDPNSLTPTNSQRQILERNRNASWEPRTVQSAPQLRRSITDIYSSTSPNPATSNRNAWMARASARSTFQPIKRPRLCSNADISPSKEVQRSPFFDGKFTDTSPSAGKKTKGRQKKKMGFDVWSDDTAEDILRHLECGEVEQKVLTHGPEEVPKIAKESMTNLDEVPMSPPLLKENSDESQSSHGTSQLNKLELDSREQSFVSTSSAITYGKNPEEFTDLLEFQVKTVNQKLKANKSEKTFSAQPADRQLQALRSLTPVAPPLNNRTLTPSGVDDAGNSVYETATSTTAVRAVSQTFVYQSPERQAAALSSIHGETHLDAQVAKKRNTVVSSPEQRPQTQRSQSTGKGSEDLLIPSSPGDITEVDHQSPRQKLDLKAFRFVG